MELEKKIPRYEYWEDSLVGNADYWHLTEIYLGTSYPASTQIQNTDDMPKQLLYKTLQDRNFFLILYMYSYFKRVMG